MTPTNEARKERLLRELRQASLLRESRLAFADANGWSVSRSCFSGSCVARGGCHDSWWGSASDLANEYVDHAEYYREVTRPYRAACIVAHLYGPTDGCNEVARNLGLRANILADRWQSWWFPGSTQSVAYTRPDVAVVWPNIPEILAAVTQELKIAANGGYDHLRTRNPHASKEGS